MAEILAGKGLVYGLGITGSVGITGAVTIIPEKWNVSDIDFAEEFKLDKLINQEGTRTETMVASQRERRITINFVPTGADRDIAKAVAEAFTTLQPLSVLTFAGFRIAALNASWNYTGGVGLKFVRETWLVANIGLLSIETSVANVFSSLAVI